jgi:hypothetical protein
MNASLFKSFVDAEAINADWNAKAKPFQLQKKIKRSYKGKEVTNFF